MNVGGKQINRRVCATEIKTYSEIAPLCTDLEQPGAPCLRQRYVLKFCVIECTKALTGSAH